MTPDEIIDMLGGNAAVADAAGVSRNAATNWRRHGIPGKYWPALVRFAKDKRRYKINMMVLEFQIKPTAPRRRAGGGG